MEVYYTVKRCLNWLLNKKITSAIYTQKSFTALLPKGCIINHLMSGLVPFRVLYDIPHNKYPSRIMKRVKGRPASLTDSGNSDQIVIPAELE